MKTVAYYVLRERSRPSEEEGCLMAMGLLIHSWSYGKGLSTDRAEAEEQVPLYVSFPFDPAGDAVSQMRKYITSVGGGHYLAEPGRYEVVIATSKEGNPPEEACTAMIIDRGEQANETKTPPEVQSILDRGRRWEELGRTGDALHCYAAGRDVYGDHPELLLRLGTLRLGFECLLPGAMECLMKAHQASPKNLDVTYHLALCYSRLADAKTIQLGDTTPARMKEMALSLLEEAVAASEGDARLGELAQRLKADLGDDTESFFRDQ